MHSLDSPCIHKDLSTGHKFGDFSGSLILITSGPLNVIWPVSCFSISYYSPLFIQSFTDSLADVYILFICPLISSSQVCLGISNDHR